METINFVAAPTVRPCHTAGNEPSKASCVIVRGGPPLLGLFWAHRSDGPKALQSADSSCEAQSCLGGFELKNMVVNLYYLPRKDSEQLRTVTNVQQTPRPEIEIKVRSSINSQNYAHGSIVRPSIKLSTTICIESWRSLQPMIHFPLFFHGYVMLTHNRQNGHKIRCDQVVRDITFGIGSVM